jgi:hypothetical protein
VIAEKETTVLPNPASAAGSILVDQVLGRWSHFAGHQLLSQVMPKFCRVFHARPADVFDERVSMPFHCQNCLRNRTSFS